MLEPIESAVNVNIVDEEVNESVDGDANADEKRPMVGGDGSDDVACHAWDGEDEEEEVVFFKESFF